MKPEQFAALAATALVSFATALFVYSAHAPWSASETSGGKLVPQLAAAAGKAHRIEIAQGAAKIALERSGDAWTVAEHAGYPADAEKIRGFLVGLSEAELIEPKTRNKERFSILAVEDQSPNSNARHVKVLDKEGVVLAEAIAGKSRAEQVGSGQGTYVRKAGEAQAWLASTAIVGGASLRDWVQPRVFEMATEKIKKLTVEVAGAAPYDVKREGDQHVLADIPAGKKIKFVNATDIMIEAASFLEFDDVAKATVNTAGEAGSATLETDSGLKITMKIRRDQDATWATLAAEGDGEAKKAADEIKARTDGWEFKILPSKANSILKKKDELLEDAAS